MGIARLLRGRYGSEPEIDIEMQAARVRVTRPRKFDFKALHEGITRNNIGLSSLRLRANVMLKDGKVTIQPTGQSFPLRGEAADVTEPSFRWLQINDWTEPDRTSVEVIESPLESSPAQTLPEPAKEPGGP
ncbi:MAG: hypothetical protein O7H41_16855 [Planctomycetota bacterium]|nr:hypothetical protein [Planctomycetota bacterium]